MDQNQSDQIVDTYPLSPMQQGMLFRWVSDPASGNDIEQVVCTLTERLNSPLFLKAWNRVVNQHAVFKTAFRWEKVPEPIQDIHRQVTVPYTDKDWTKLSSTEQDVEMSRYLASDRQQGFDLSKPGSLRVMVARLSANGFKCVWTFHHIILDGRSFAIVLNEVFSLYDAFCRNEDPALLPPRPFREYIDWLKQQDWSKAEEFWRERLKGFTVPTPLGTIRPAPPAAGREFTRGEQDFQISAQATDSLREYASRIGVTLNTLVQGAWALLLSRYSGEDEVVFGTIRACRHSTVKDANSMVGIFINTIPLRVPVPADMEVESWLKELRGQEFALREYEHTPLFKIQQWSGIQGGKSLFESLVMFDHATLNTTLQKQGLVGRSRTFDLKEQVGFPVVLQAYGEAALTLKIEYCRAIFDDDAVSRMLTHIEAILSGMATDTHKLVGNLSLLSAPERKQVLFDWNESEKEYPSGVCIHKLVEEQVIRTPNGVALTCDGVSVTYRELNAKANRLAKELRKLGVGPDVLVGICMERTNELVIGLLAILKADGAYLPIDLAYPADRLAFMLSDAQAPVLLTQSKLTKDLPETNAKVLCVDQLLAAQLSASDDENLSSSANPDHLAYVIYTSGTTGKPKGSMITHRNVTRLFTATDHWYGFNEKDVWSLFHSYAFDFSVWEIWGALLYGGRVVVVPYMVSRSTEAFYQLLAAEKVTVLNQTPSAFRQLIQAEEAVGQKPLALRYVIFGGEALEMQSLRAWFDRHGDQQPKLVNMYGITETTVHVTYRPLSKDDVKSSSVIGIPIPDLQVYILDPQRQPVPIGVAGEMYVGGAGLARGYLKRTDLTNERFISDHLTNRVGSRLYKTGDLARFLPGHDIEYLGRIDHQVKIRGFRIELGEIESVLCQHPSLREAVVLAREDTPDNKRLVAYLISNGTKPPVTELREHLKKKMPEYMVPAVFMFLEKIPLTTNGKVDRKALPVPDQERPDIGSAYVAPQTETQKEICRIWSEVLGVAKISAQDDFFVLGGHSLIVLRAISLINDRFKTRLAPAALFEHRTVADLSALVDSKSQGHEQPSVSARAITSDVMRTAGAESNLAPVAEIVAQRNGRPLPGTTDRPFRMQESWVCRHILSPLYNYQRKSFRTLLQSLILKMEGGDYFTVTLRKLYKKHYDIHIGDYTAGCFDAIKLREKTKVGRFTSIAPTVVMQTADHPRNTISTNAIFYHPAFGFADGYELERTKLEIGNDVFIGHNATILYPTKKIGDGAVIATGSIVVGDVPAYAIVGGYPAAVLSYRFSKQKIAELEQSRWWEASLEELEPVKNHFAKPLEGEKIR